MPSRQTPAAGYTAPPRATPGRQPGTHDRDRADTIDTNGTVTLRHAGRLYHIGVGRTHARTHVIMLVHDLNVRIINAACGKLLRQLTLDPTATTSPPATRPGPRPSAK